MLSNLLVCVHAHNQLAAQRLGLSKGIRVSKVDHVIAAEKDENQVGDDIICTKQNYLYETINFV